MEDCIFCKIVNKEVGSNIRYEDENVICFDDINPAAKIHVLVVPKKHFATLNDAHDKEIIADIYRAIDKIVEKINIKDKGYRVIVNVGEDGGQVVKHLHFHILAGQKLGEKVC